jgi:general secretion pathway protein M
MAGAGLLCAILYLLYFLIYSPLNASLHKKSLELAEKQETLAWMEQVKKQSTSQTTVEKIGNTKLLALLGKQLNETFKAYPYQLQQTAGGELQLTFEKVPYNAFLLLLWNLTNHYTITLKQFSAERTETAGIVKLAVVLSAQ